MAFTPKQALPITPELYNELTGDAMPQMARASLAAISIPPGSLVHDNGCGTGAGSQALLEEQPDITIKATDIDEAALKVYSWNGETSAMDSAALTFPDNTFTHTLMNATVFVLPNDGIDSVKEIYRTLRPGGRAIINCIAYGPNLIPIARTSISTRPEGTPIPRQGLEKWHDPAFLKNIVEQSGFKDLKMSTVVYKCTTRTDFDRFAQMLWSVVGGGSSVGWIKSDEERWDEAIEILKKELRAAKGFEVFEDRIELEFQANVAIATKGV